MKTSSRKGFNSSIITAIIVFIISFILASFSGIFDGSAKEMIVTPEEAEKNRIPFIGSGYVLQFNRDFIPSLSAVDQTGISLVIAVDSSSSMQDPLTEGGDPKYLILTKLVHDLVDYLEVFLTKYPQKKNVVKIGILTFHTHVEELVPLTVLDKEGFVAIRKVLEDPRLFEPGGRTCIGEAIEKGAEILGQSGTLMRSMILLADGENNTEPNPVNVMWAMHENRNTASSIDVPVRTRATQVNLIGVGESDPAYAALSQAGVRVHYPKTPKELKKQLLDVVALEFDKLDAPDSKRAGKRR